MNGRQAAFSILLLVSSIFTVTTLIPIPHVEAVGILTFTPNSGTPSAVVVLSGTGFIPETDCWSNSSDFYRLRTSSGPMIPLQDATGSCSVDPSGSLWGYFVVRTDALDGSYGLSLQGAVTPFTVVVATATTTATTTETTTLWSTISSTITSLFTSNQTRTSTVYSPTVVLPTFTLTTLTTSTISVPYTVYYGVTTVPSTTTIPVTTTSTSTKVSTTTSTSTQYTGTTSYTTTATVNGVTYVTVYTGVSTVTSQYVVTVNNYVTTVLGGTRTTYATRAVTNTSYTQIPTTTGMMTQYTTATVQTYATLTDHTTLTETMPYIPPMTTSQNEGNFYGFPVPSIRAPDIGWFIPAVGVIAALGVVGVTLAVKKGRISTAGGMGQFIQGATGVQTSGVDPDLIQQPIPPEGMVGETVATGDATPPASSDPSSNAQQYCAKCGETVLKGRAQCHVCGQRVSEPISTLESEASAEQLGKLQEGLGGLP